jgi:hypothetical protein
VLFNIHAVFSIEAVISAALYGELLTHSGFLDVRSHDVILHLFSEFDAVEQRHALAAIWKAELTRQHPALAQVVVNYYRELEPCLSHNDYTRTEYDNLVQRWMRKQAADMGRDMLEITSIAPGNLPIGSVTECFEYEDAIA